MARQYGMSVCIESSVPLRLDTDAVVEACAAVWPFEFYTLTCETIEGGGLGSLGGGETAEQFAERLARAVFVANGAPCCVEIRSTYLEDLPYSTHLFEEEDYERLAGCSPGPPQEENQDPVPTEYREQQPVQDEPGSPGTNRLPFEQCLVKYQCGCIGFPPDKQGRAVIIVSCDREFGDPDVSMYWRSIGVEKSRVAVDADEAGSVAGRLAGIVGIGNVAREALRNLDWLVQRAKEM